MIYRILKVSLFFVLISVFLGLNFFVLAEENLEQICKLEKIENECGSVSPENCRFLLEKCEKFYQNKSNEYKKDIQKTQVEKKTLQNTIYILDSNIKKINNQIYEGNLIIKDLSFQINDTEISIEKTSLEIEDSKEKLVQVLRKIYEQDQETIVEIFITEEKLSDFFNDIVALEELSDKNQELLQQIKNLKSYLKNQKTSLDREKEETEKMVLIQDLQRQESKQSKYKKENLLKVTKGKESEYQKLLKETQQKAQEIRSRIFELIGVPDAPTFGEAYEIAKYVEGLTGVRPALLLAVLKQESNIGKNVGQCYLKNSVTGSGVVAYNGKVVSRVMKPTRDVSPFLTITKELGRDPYNTLVSCPMSYGWGGAMGPAQFIPSTWSIYRSKIAKITGRPGDPWNIRDAFLAAGLYLGKYGAANQTYNSEWRASMIYFSGSTNVRYRFYGDSVMGLAGQLQKDIDLIK